MQKNKRFSEVYCALRYPEYSFIRIQLKNFRLLIWTKKQQLNGINIMIQKIWTVLENCLQISLWSEFLEILKITNSSQNLSGCTNLQTTFADKKQICWNHLQTKILSESLPKQSQLISSAKKRKQNHMNLFFNLKMTPLLWRSKILSLIRFQPILISVFWTLPQNYLLNCLQTMWVIEWVSLKTRKNWRWSWSETRFRNFQVKWLSKDLYSSNWFAIKKINPNPLSWPLLKWATLKWLNWKASWIRRCSQNKPWVSI